VVELISLSGRRLFYLRGTQPACFYLADVHAGGVLVSAAGVGAWRAAGVQVIASVEEAASVDATIDQPVDRKVRLLREIDFLPMPGRTRGSCALRVKPSPAIVFFGPILDHGDWPGLVAHADDHSFENRLIGALGLRGQRFEFAFCDNYVHGQSRFGPGAADAVRRNLTDRIATAQQPGGLSCRVITPR